MRISAPYYKGEGYKSGQGSKGRLDGPNPRRIRACSLLFSSAEAPIQRQPTNAASDHRTELQAPATGLQISIACFAFLFFPASCGVSEANPQTDPLPGPSSCTHFTSPTRCHAGSIRRPRCVAFTTNSHLLALLSSSGRQGLIVCLVLLSAAVRPVNNRASPSSPPGRKRNSVLSAMAAPKSRR